MNFDYYYGIEVEQFFFYRIPRLLIKDARFKTLSSDAKLLYGLLLDRMSLSMKNGWLDEENRAYIIYTVENIMEDMCCSKPKCIKIMRELDAVTGIGLIEKKRRGLGKPDIIYVKNFATAFETAVCDDQKELPEENNDDCYETDELISDDEECLLPEVKDVYFKKSKNVTSGSKECLPPEVKDVYFRKSENVTSGSKECLPAEVKDFYPNYNNNNYTDLNNTNPNHINPSEYERGIEGYDFMNEADRLISVIKNNVEYEHHMMYDNEGDREMFRELFEIIRDVVCVIRPYVKISGNEYPYELVRERFLKLRSSHLEYVMRCMKENNKKIKNINAYMIATLYNAPATMNHYYRQAVNHDMTVGRWDDISV